MIPFVYEPSLQVLLTPPSVMTVVVNGLCAELTETAPLTGDSRKFCPRITSHHCDILLRWFLPLRFKSTNSDLRHPSPPSSRPESLKYSALMVIYLFKRLTHRLIPLFLLLGKTHTIPYFHEIRRCFGLVSEHSSQLLHPFVIMCSSVYGGKK